MAVKSSITIFESHFLRVFSCPVISSINHLPNSQLQPETHDSPYRRLPLFFPNRLCSSLKIKTLSNGSHQMRPYMTDTGRMKHMFNKLPFSLPFRGRNSALWLTLLPGDTNFLCVSMSRVAFVSGCVCFIFHSRSVSSFHQTHVLNCFMRSQDFFPQHVPKSGCWMTVAYL